MSGEQAWREISESLPEGFDVDAEFARLQRIAHMHRQLARYRRVADEAKLALAFYQQVMESTEAERVAAGDDHHEWLRGVAARLALVRERD